MKFLPINFLHQPITLHPVPDIGTGGAKQMLLDIITSLIMQDLM